MKINFDRPVNYECDDYTHYVRIPQEYFSMLVNTFMRLEDGKVNHLAVFFENLYEDSDGFYGYSRTACSIQRFIDARISDFPRIER